MKLDASIQESVDRVCREATACTYDEGGCLISLCEPHAILNGNRGQEAREKFITRIGFERHERSRWLKSEFAIDQEIHGSVDCS